MDSHAIFTSTFGMRMGVFELKSGVL